MSFLKRLLGRNDPPKRRVRVCVECGMPVAEHKDWCSILRGEIEMRERRANRTAAAGAE
jgi:predicted nucleic acid-binding Zn ribbon protein